MWAGGLPVILLEEGSSIRLSKMALSANELYQVLVTDLSTARRRTGQ